MSERARAHANTLRHTHTYTSQCCSADTLTKHARNRCTHTHTKRSKQKQNSKTKQKLIKNSKSIILKTCFELNARTHEYTNFRVLYLCIFKFNILFYHFIIASRSRMREKLKFADKNELIVDCSEEGNRMILVKGRWHSQSMTFSRIRKCPIDTDISMHHPLPPLTHKMRMACSIDVTWLGQRGACLVAVIVFVVLRIACHFY